MVMIEHILGYEVMDVMKYDEVNADECDIWSLRLKLYNDNTI
jgi:hypothetical protein